MPDLVLGPMLRYVDARTATIWMQTDSACEIEVIGSRTRSLQVSGRHFALAAIDGLATGVDHRYEVRLDGRQAWPRDDQVHPASTVRLLDERRPRRLLFGSCRITRPHEPP